MEGHSQAGLHLNFNKLASIRSANDSRASREQTGLVEKSAEIGEICGEKPENSAPPASDWVYALKNVSFEVKRGEVLGIIGRNGAGNQAAGQLLGRLPQAARRVRRRGQGANQIDFAQDSFAGNGADFGADQGAPRRLGKLLGRLPNRQPEG